MLNPKIKIFFPACLLIFVSLFSAYHNTLHNPFIWDDESLIVKNPLIKDISLCPKLFTNDLYYPVSTGSNFYRPLQTLSYMWDYYFWQLDPKGYHLTNILLQGIAAFMVLWLVYIIFENIFIALGSALLFALSPLNTEAVTYLSGRAELLLGIFLLSSLVFFIKDRIFFSLLSFILALLSKELALVFPFAILAYVFYFKRERLKQSGYLLKYILPFFIVSFFYLALRLSVLHFATARPSTLTHFHFLVRIAALPKAIFIYLRLSFVPIGLHMSWELTRPITFFGFFIAYFILGISIVFCIKILKFHPQRRIASFFVFWSLLFFLPQSGIFPINAFIAEHFIYLSSISFFIGVSYLLYKYMRKSVFIISLVLILIYYGFLTYSRNVEWSDPVVFYKDILKYSPASHQAYNNLGLQYEYRGDYNMAIAQYQQALKIMPDLLEAHANLANLYSKLGKFKEAESEYLIVEKITPAAKLGEVENNIGGLYQMQGLIDKAQARYERALKLDGRLHFTYFNLARIYFEKGDLAAATQEIARSLPEITQSADKDKPYLKNISDLLADKKELPVAPLFYNDLGVLFAKSGFYDAALYAFRRCIETAPGYTDAHFNLALVYLAKERTREAEGELKICLRSNPKHPRVVRLLFEIKKKHFPK